MKADEPTAEDRDSESKPARPDWVPAVASLGGLLVGGGLGIAIGLKDGFDNALRLGAVAGLIVMVLVIVPVAKWQRPDDPDVPAPPFVNDGESLIAAIRRARAVTAARTPVDGLLTRSVPNRRAEPTGRIAGGLVVRVIRRSGIWASVLPEGKDEEDDPIWVERRYLEAVENPPTTD